MRTSRTSASSARPSASSLFDINDFDETLPGPWEWDVKRLAASFAVAGRERGFSATGSARRSSLPLVGEYRNAMRELRSDAQSRGLVRARSTSIELLADSRDGLDASDRASSSRRHVAKARTKDSLRAFEKLTHVVDGQPRIISDPPLIVPIEELARPARTRHDLDDVWRGCSATTGARSPATGATCSSSSSSPTLARKVVGVGSVGTRAWIVLLLGRDDGDPLFLQVKEAQPSVLEPFLGQQRVRQPRPARRRRPAADAGRERHLPRLDAHRGGIDGSQRDFYVRQLHDWKGSADDRER